MCGVSYRYEENITKRFLLLKILESRQKILPSFFVWSEWSNGVMKVVTVDRSLTVTIDKVEVLC